MRRILATSLLLSSLSFAAAANASTPVDDATAPTPTIRVSTGVTDPVLIGSASLILPDDFSVNAIPNDAQVGLSLTVDEKGQPQDIHVVKSYSPFWDARVVDTVQHFHFKPGMLSNEPISVDMNLTINISH
jgi:hypothetical protein